MRVGWALTPDCELDSKTTDIKWQLHSSRSNVSEVLFDAATSHFSANLNAHIRQSIHDCIPKHILGDKMRKSVLNPIRNSAINLIEDLHSLWPDKPFAVSTIDWNSCQSTMVRNRRDARCFAHEAGSTLQNVSFYRFQIRLDDFRGYLLKSIAEQTADEATIEEVHSLPFISLTFGF